jgi:hypothetical protein
METTRQRRYAVIGDGITVHAETLEEAISLYRERRAGPPEPLPWHVEEFVQPPSDDPGSAA